MAGQIRGRVEIEGQPASRVVVAVSYAQFLVAGSSPPVMRRQIVGEAVSHSTTGEYTITSDYTGPVVLLSMDNWGDEWVSGRLYSIGDIVHPTRGRETGFVYRCISAGTGGSVEPSWWTDASGNTGSDGDAILEAQQFWRPIGAGPIHPEIIGDSDPYWNNVATLLHFDGTDGSTTFVDEKGRAWARSGAAGISTSQSKFGGASLLLPQGSYLTTVDGSGLNIGTGDFTVEGWVYITGGNYQVLYGQLGGAGAGDGDPGFVLFARNSGHGNVVRLYDYGLAVGYNSGVVLTLNTFHFLEVSRVLGILRIFVDGIKVMEIPSTSNYSTPVRARIGAIPADQVLGFVSSGGYIDEVRVTVGAGRHTEDYTPPVGPFLNQ